MARAHPPALPIQCRAHAALCRGKDPADALSIPSAASFRFWTLISGASNGVARARVPRYCLLAPAAAGGPGSLCIRSQVELQIACGGLCLKPSNLSLQTAQDLQGLANTQQAAACLTSPQPTTTAHPHLLRRSAAACPRVLRHR